MRGLRALRSWAFKRTLEGGFEEDPPRGSRGLFSPELGVRGLQEGIPSFHQDHLNVHDVGAGWPCDYQISEGLEEVIGVVFIEVP